MSFIQHYSFVTLQAFVNMENNAKQERKNKKEDIKEATKIDYTMTECNHGNSFTMEKTSRMLQAQKKTEENDKLALDPVFEL